MIATVKDAINEFTQAIIFVYSSPVSQRFYSSCLSSHGEALRTECIAVRANFQKILRHGLFLSAPFLFYVNQSVDPLAHLYGLRICLFNSSIVKNPFQKDWDTEGSENSSRDRVSNVLQVRNSRLEIFKNRGQF